MKECLKKRGLDVREARRIVHDRSECRGFVRGGTSVVARGINPLTLTRYHSYVLSQLYEALEGCKFVCDQVHRLRV